MPSLFTDIWDDHFWAAIACCFAAIVMIGTWADRRRNNRKNIEKVGFMPWTAIIVFGVLVTVVSIALAIKNL